MIVRDELFEQFLIEGRELLERATADLATLARDPRSPEALDSLFRALHTLKGSAGLFDLPELTQLLHAAESRLEVARRDGVLASEEPLRLERALDLVDAWLEALDRDGAPSDRLRQDTVSLERGDSGPAPPAPASEGPPDWARALASGAEGAVVALRYTPVPESYFRGDDPLAILGALPGLLRLEIETPAASGADYDPFRCQLTVRALSSAPLTDLRTATRFVADQVELVAVEAPPRTAPPPAGGLLRSLRVDADDLDQVASLVDELVIAKNVLMHQTARLALAAGAAARSRELANGLASVERVVSDLHASVTRLRLVSLSHIFARLPRQARDIAEALGKEVEIVVTGETISVDKSMLEHLHEPLLHLVRNALDHGIEPPGRRAELGKRPRARLAISAQAARDEVIIDVADDGRGIDVARARAIAVERGLMGPDEADALSDAAAADLVFAAGFSTAGEVTELSGRGVGMDAVRAAVTRAGGHVSLQNRPGQGLSVRLAVPARVVLTKVLVVEAGGERFGVPLDSVRETHRLRHQDVTAVRAGRAYVRRDEVIPLLRLSELLGVAAAADAAAFPVLRIRAGSEEVGIQIDGMGERVEAPLRPMGGVLAGYPGVLGTVLQGDGEVLLVLDLAELAA